MLPATRFNALTPTAAVWLRLVTDGSTFAEVAPAEKANARLTDWNAVCSEFRPSAFCCTATPMSPTRVAVLKVLMAVCAPGEPAVLPEPLTEAAPAPV